MHKKLFFTLSLCSLSLFLIACGKENIEASQTNTLPVEEHTTQEDISSSSKNEVVEEKTEDNSEESAEDTAITGLVSHLCDVANDPNVTTNTEDGVSYMIIYDKDGNRRMGSIGAYYSGLSFENASDKESFCKAFIEEKMPEIADKFSTAEFHDEGGYYGVVINITECSVTLMPDKDLQGMTVYVTVN